MTPLTPPPASSEDARARVPDNQFATLAAATGSTPACGNSDPVVVAGYVIERELGRGGMGVVYQARQTALQRIVALKMILAGGHAGATELQRFRTEAEAIARLHHPNIVQIYEVGEQNGLPYFSFEFCPGGSLDRRLGGTPMVPLHAAELLEKLARAMQTAHDKGIVHRDLSPGNVLFDAAGVPKISDFGLAKKLDEATQTATGAIMGTPSYMAPEQAGGKSKEVGPHSDVYALGAILYECLTGRPPFKAATALDTLVQVIADEPVPPTRLTVAVPADLETICLHCLHKDPRSRYTLAGELADDLGRFLAGVPIRARPVGRLERAVKWVKRNTVVTALVAAVLLSLLIGSVGIFVKYLDAEAQAALAHQKAQDATEQAKVARAAEREADEQKKLAEEGQRQTTYQLMMSNVLLAQAAWDSNDVAVARARLAAVPPAFRGWEWHYLNRRYQGGIVTLEGHGHYVKRVAFSPDGKRVATASYDRTARVWDARTGQLLVECKGHDGTVEDVAFSPDGLYLATMSSDMTVRLWDVQSGRQLQIYKGHTNDIWSMSISPDGMRLATASRDQMVRVWDVRTGKQLLECKNAAVYLSWVVFSPDGMRLATAGDGSARVWDAQTGKPLVECTGHTGYVSCVAFSPDGKRLATGSGDHTVRLWDATTGRQVQVCTGHTGGIESVAFSPDGTRLATASRDRTARVIDARTGQLLLECKGHTHEVFGVAFSPDGTRVATASFDHTARICDARTAEPVLECKGGISSITSLTYTRDGTRLVTAGFDRRIRLWDPRTAQQLFVVKDQNDGGGAGGSVVTCSLDGKRLAALVDQIVHLWDSQTGRPLEECKGVNDLFSVYCLAFGPDGTLLASGTDLEGSEGVWDVQTGRRVLHCSAYIRSMAFHPTGTQLVTASWDKTARLWDVRTGKELLVCKGHTAGLSCVAFSPDGKYFATASADQTARVWDARTGQQLFVCKGHTGTVDSLAFTPDGKRLATVSHDFTARLWDTQTGQQLLVCQGHRSYVNSVAFSPDGNWLATASDRTVRLWDARPLPLHESEELTYRQQATRPDPIWHEQQFALFTSDSLSDRFAAAFHLDRLLAYTPAQRTALLRRRTAFLEAGLKLDTQDTTARLLLARTAWHSPTLAPNDIAALIPTADAKSLLAQRTRAGLLLREKKAVEAVRILEDLLKERNEDRPPVEELLLSWAYLETQQRAKATEQWAKALAWLDRQQEAVRAANIVCAIPGGILSSVTSLYTKPVDPRYHAFDWETWHELDVLRSELAPRLAEK